MNDQLAGIGGFKTDHRGLIDVKVSLAYIVSSLVVKIHLSLLKVNKSIFCSSQIDREQSRKTLQYNTSVVEWLIGFFLNVDCFDTNHYLHLPISTKNHSYIIEIAMLNNNIFPLVLGCQSKNHYRRFDVMVTFLLLWKT